MAGRESARLLHVVICVCAQNTSLGCTIPCFFILRYSVEREIPKLSAVAVIFH